MFHFIYFKEIAQEKRRPAICFRKHDCSQLLNSHTDDLKATLLSWPIAQTVHSPNLVPRFSLAPKGRVGGNPGNEVTQSSIFPSSGIERRLRYGRPSSGLKCLSLAWG